MVRTAVLLCAAIALMLAVPFSLSQVAKKTSTPPPKTKTTTKAKAKTAANRSQPIPVACPKSCAAPGTGAQTYTFDVDKFLADPNDPTNDTEICLRVAEGDEVKWKTTKEMRVNKIDAFGGHHGNPFKKALPFVPGNGQTDVQSGPLTAGSAPGAAYNRCWLFKANIQVKENGNWADKDPHIFTSPGGGPILKH